MDYGKKLTGEEYDREVIRLHVELPPVPIQKVEYKTECSEMDLWIDYKLGVDFPEEKRVKLWEIQKEVKRKLYRLIPKYYFLKLFRKCIDKDINDLTKYLYREFKTVLTQEEFNEYFRDYKD